jgi:hypothetical protein
MPKHNPITDNIDRSTEVYTASGKDARKDAVLAEIAAQPIGSVAGDPRPGVAFNVLPAQAVYFARNRSSELPRKVITQSYSARQHIPEKLQQKYHMDGATIAQQIDRGLANYDETETAIEPVDKVLMWDSKRYVIRCSREPGKPGEWQPIPEGLWDLYLGNYERMHHADAQVRKEEGDRLRGVMGGKNIVFEEGERPNEWAYIEFRREEITSEPVATDREKIYQGVPIEI